jgi:tight adherence protein C
MSDLILLVVAVFAAGAAVFLGVVAVDMSQTEKHRAVRLLESQVSAGSGSEPVDLRQQELSEGFNRRIVAPVVSKAGRFAKRITPLEERDRISKKLVVAGSPAGWDAERVMAFKIIFAVVGFVGGLVISAAVGIAPLIALVVIALLSFVGFIAPDSVLNRRVEERQKEILASLSDTLDLLTISVEAGLSLNAAIAQVVQNVPGVLSSEFARMLQEVQLGVPRSDAFRHLAERTDVDELNAFALAMVQADAFGVSIASVLRTQAQQLRIKRRQRAEAKAQQTPVKIVFPLILCVLPSLFVIIVGPGAIRIYEGFVRG